MSFQPISSESGLRQWLPTTRPPEKSLFNPYPAKADCDARRRQWYNKPKSLFNPYPAKADCDGQPHRRFSLHIPLFNPYPAKADCDNGCENVSGCGKTLFNPYPAKADCDKTKSFPHSLLFTFQPISSESGLRPINYWYSWAKLCLFNPYPAKADCDVYGKTFVSVHNFSTHIQRKRIATWLILPRPMR